MYDYLFYSLQLFIIGFSVQDCIVFPLLNKVIEVQTVNSIWLAFPSTADNVV